MKTQDLYRTFDQPDFETNSPYNASFDSFDCAIHVLAPQCAHCGASIIGHSIQDDGSYFCCDGCAHASNVMQGRASF